jgi:hypothetical protein
MTIRLHHRPQYNELTVFPSNRNTVDRSNTGAIYRAKSHLQTEDANQQVRSTKKVKTFATNWSDCEVTADSKPSGSIPRLRCDGGDRRERVPSRRFRCYLCRREDIIRGKTVQNAALSSWLSGFSEETSGTSRTEATVRLTGFLRGEYVAEFSVFSFQCCPSVKWHCRAILRCSTICSYNCR